MFYCPTLNSEWKIIFHNDCRPKIIHNTFNNIFYICALLWVSLARKYHCFISLTNDNIAYRLLAREWTCDLGETERVTNRESGPILNWCELAPEGICMFVRSNLIPMCCVCVCMRRKRYRNGDKPSIIWLQSAPSGYLRFMHDSKRNTYTHIFGNITWFAADDEHE